MNTLHRAVLEVLSDAPYDVLTEIVAEKLADAGVNLSPGERHRLKDQLKFGEDEAIRVGRWGWRDTTVVKLTPEDLEAVGDRVAKIVEDLPQLLRTAMDESAVRILESLRRRWRRESRRQDRERKGFEQRLYKRWGTAIEKLRMFVTISRELGANINHALRDEGHCSDLADVLTRLHARACQVAEEVTCLLRGGFADGAIARWRTLHEIAVVALFLAENSGDLAKRYIDHQAIESYKAAEEYQKHYERLGYEPLSAAERDQIQEAYDEVKSRYGAAFGNPYGWASEVLGCKNPQFRDIELAVGVDHLRAHYRMASHNVHANPMGVFFKLGLLDESDVLLAGASNAGLTEPGHATAISLLQVSSSLVLVRATVDNVVALKILFRLADEVGEAFADAHESLLRDSTRS